MTRLKRLGIQLPALILFTLVTVILRTVALYTQYNPGNSYFEGKLLISLSDGILFAGMLILASFLLTSPRLDLVASFTGSLTFIPSGMVCAALLFLGLDMVMRIAEQPGEFLSKLTFTDPHNIFVFIIAALAIICVLNFLTTVLYTNKENDTRALFGVLMVLFITLYAAYLYFDSTLPINAPNKITDQTAFLFAALFFVFETRISLGREMWRLYCTFGFIASLFTAYSSIPTLIYYFGSGDMVSDSLVGSVLCFTLFVYITARLVLVLFLIKNEKNDAVIAIEILAERRNEELAIPAQARIDKNDENMNTIGKNYEFNLPMSTESTPEKKEEPSEEGEQ